MPFNAKELAMKDKIWKNSSWNTILSVPEKLHAKKKR